MFTSIPSLDPLLQCLLPTFTVQIWDLKALAFRRPLPVYWGMEHYRRTAHTRFDLKYHFVWTTKYRKKLLRGEISTRLRQIARDICAVGG